MRRAVNDQVDPVGETSHDFFCVTDRRLCVETATDKEHRHGGLDR